MPGERAGALRAHAYRTTSRASSRKGWMIPTSPAPGGQNGGPCTTSPEFKRLSGSYISWPRWRIYRSIRPLMAPERVLRIKIMRVPKILSPGIIEQLDLPPSRLMTSGKSRKRLHKKRLGQAFLEPERMGGSALLDGAARSWRDRADRRGASGRSGILGDEPCRNETGGSSNGSFRFGHIEGC